MEEARPNYLRGYGGLTEDAAAEVEAALAQILDLMGRMEAYLAQGSAGELAARLARLELTREAVALVQELARIITAHGLVEFRGALEMLVERLESPGLEVAVFGRVNSGKSSLLNYLLQADVLPVGATPVTGLPTRVRYAAEPDARVQFAQSPHQIIPLDRVVEFATEQSNPANAKQVLRIDIALPSPILKDGAVLVDTPGLGSLATAGAAESLAYLPRCDLGLVLVDAGSALGPDDVALVDALHRAGAGVMALLSKADVMPSDDRDRAVDYMREQLRAHTGTETPVYPVSVRGEHAVLCGQWLTSALGPQLEDQRSAAERSLRRKIGALREAVIAAFQARLSVTSPAQGHVQWRAAEQALSQALARLDAAGRRSPDGDAWITAVTEQILDEVAHAGAAPERAGPPSPDDIADILASALRRGAQRMASAVAGDLAELRALVSGALQDARAALAVPSDELGELPEPRGMPALDDAGAVGPVRPPGPLTCLLGPIFVYHGIKRRLQRRTRTEVTKTLEDCARTLERWCLRELEDLRRALGRDFELLRGRYRSVPLAPEPSASDLRAIQEDIERLKHWNEPLQETPVSTASTEAPAQPPQPQPQR